jgi:penicillin-binding protein 1C
MIVPYLFSAFLILVLVSLVLVLKDLPAPASLTNKQVAQTTKILDRNGELLYNIYVSENRTIIPISDIPKHTRQATIAIEDKEFYKHGGINIVGGIFRAMRNSVLGRRLEGGSTITQQLIKISLLTPERTIIRKIKEAILAFWTEKIYSKDQILAMYMNRVPYGGTAYGIEEAAQIYFGKHAKNLTLAESALLAGLPQAPTYYSPFGTDPTRAFARQKLVLARMVEDGYITSVQKTAAENEDIKFASPSSGIKAPHFVAYVREILVKKYGEEKVETGGLKVTTSLDLNLQEAAQATVSSEVEKEARLKVSNGAALITKPNTGEILAMVGSVDYFATGSGKVNVTLANRSPGSSIKPLNFALGFLKGTTTPATAWVDALFCFPSFNGKSYCPQNYDGKFHGVVQTRFALGNSLNIPAVKELAVNTLPDFIATASAMGITTFNDGLSRYGYSLTLGGGEIKMVDMAVAYGVFANSGRRQDLVPILKVEDSSGNVLENNTPDKLKIENLKLKIPGWDGSTPWIPHDGYVLPAEVTYLISHILLDDGSRSMTFGSGSLLNIPGQTVSVKTGTTEDKRDNWTIGYTPSFLVAVWVGNNDNSPMSPYLESGDTGAAPIWHGIMNYVLKGKPGEWPQKPEGLVFLEVCSLSGMLVDRDCPKRGEFFIKAFAPKEKDNVWDQKKPVSVYKDSRKQPRPFDKPNPDQLTNEDHLVISDPLQSNFCADCPL